MTKGRARKSSQKRLGKPVAIPSVKWLTTGFPMVQHIRMPFEQFTSNPITAGVNAQNGYQCNSLNQPSLTIDTSHQPFYYDQYVPQYAFYEVLKSTITVQFQNSTLLDSVKCVLSWDDNTSAISNINTLAEQVNAKHALIGPAGGSTSSAKLSHTYTPERCLGIAPGSNATRAGVGTDPSDPFLWTVTMNGAAGGGTGNVATDVHIEYWVRWSEPQSVSGS